MNEAVLCINGIVVELSQWLLPSSLIAMCQTNRAINAAYSPFIIRRVEIIHFLSAYDTHNYIESTHFVNGIKHGNLAGWYENGQKWFEFGYLDGKEHGKNKNWYKNGQLKSEYNCVNNQLCGEAKSWYENGQLKKKKNYVNSMLHGNFEKWNRYGDLLFEHWYENDILVWSSEPNDF